MSEFIRDIDSYQREYDFKNIAMEDLAVFLSRSRNISIEEAKQYLTQKTAKGGEFELKNPGVAYLRRKKNGDRVLEQSNLLEYIGTLTQNNLIIAPNLTVYVRPEQKKSLLADYIQMNMKLRKADKKLMFDFRMRGDKKAAAYYKTMQESRKVKNNSLSGMHASPSTVGYNKSSHSSLTSLCRCATSYANASNEKFLGGLRHYYAPSIVYNHLLTSMRACDNALMTKVIEEYNLHYPTTDEVMSVIHYSTHYYWNVPAEMEKIRNFVDTMTPVEKAGFCYVGDLYHFDKYNSEFVGGFLKEMSYMDTSPCDNAREIIKGLDDNYTAIASLLSAPLIKGILLEDAETQKPEAYQTVASTAIHMRKTMAKYKDMIQAFLVQPYLPHSVAAFPSSIRKSVPTSDTDSTIFTTQHWVDKYGAEPFSHESMSITYVVVFLISGMIQNTLLMYSANLGVSRDQLMQIEMKNEYIFPIYVLTAIAKHYFAYISAGEGNVYAEMQVERKGVNLRSSNAPRFVNDAAGDFMTTIMDVVWNGNKWNSQDALSFVERMEREIRDDILSGGYAYLNSMQIKSSESYSQGADATAYQSYEFWNKYFANKYDPAPTPPYRAVKLSVLLANKTAIAKWLDSIEDPSIREGLRDWVAQNSKTNIGLFRLPIPNIAAHGIPVEIIPIIDIRGIIREVMKPFYLVLESLGIYISNKRGTRIILDEHKVRGKLINQDPDEEILPEDEVLTVD